MSADNGIYILESLNKEYRIIHTTNIQELYYFFTNPKFEDNIEYEKEIDRLQKNGIQNPYCMITGEYKDELNPYKLKEYFTDSKIYSFDEVMKEAEKLYKSISYVEYGIRFITGWENKLFPT